MNEYAVSFDCGETVFCDSLQEAYMVAAEHDDSCDWVIDQLVFVDSSESHKED